MSLENTLKAFSARLDDISVHQKFISGSVKLGREAARFWDYGALAQAGEVKALVEGHRAGCNQVRVEDLCGALTVQLFAALEWFVGQILVKAVGQMSGAVKVFDTLPDAVSRTHVTLIGRALSKTYESPAHERVDVDQVFRKLSGCVQGSTDFELNDYVFSFYMPNLDAKSLEKCFSRIGYKLDWDKLGKKADLQQLFGETSSRKTGKAIAGFLDQCAKHRNAVAHQGDGSATVQPDDLERQLMFFKHLSVSLAEQVTVYLDDIG